jgi:preprotein translocase subunit SecD
VIEDGFKLRPQYDRQGIMVRLLVVILLIFGSQPIITSGQNQSPHLNGTQVVLRVEPSVEHVNIVDIRTTATIIARRLTGLAVDPYVVQIVNGEAIQVQFGAVDDPQGLIDILSKRALLELVDFSGLRDKAEQLVGTMIITTASGADRGEGRQNPITSKPFETVIRGDDFADVQAVVDPNFQNSWLVEFQLSPDAAKVMSAFSAAHIGEVLAIVLDGRVISAPVINAQLAEYGVITGNYTAEEAQALAAQLRAGALPLSLVVERSETLETVAPDS